MSNETLPCPPPEFAPRLRGSAVDGLHALHLQQVKCLSNSIDEVLKLAEQQSEAKNLNDLYAKLVPQLREANEHLVVATFEALDSQAAAEALSCRQMEFLSMLGHELRNPLQPINIANHLIRDIAAHDPALYRLHAVIERQIGHLVRLVDDLMDASRASAGKITVERCRLALNDVIESAVETSQHVIAGRHQRLQLEAPGEAVFVDGDMDRLTQLFSNLLLNASKYTPAHGHILIRVHNDQQQVQVQIVDDGAGIPLEIQPFIFDLFTQGPRPPESAPGGLGIGLSLVRKIAELHDGSVDVDSQGSGLGSKFTVTLPLARQSAPFQALRPDTAASAPLEPRRILYIEDNRDASETLSMVLELDGHAVTCRYDGPGGLEAAQSGAFDVIICDVGLPGMTGYEIARTLRQQAAGKLPCLIALSGFGATDPEEADAGCFDHYLIKPVSMPELNAILQQASGREPAPVGSGA